MTEAQRIRNQQQCAALRQKILKRSSGDLSEFTNEIERFDSLNDFERRIVLNAAGARHSFSYPESLRLYPVKRFEHLAIRDRLRVAQVLPMIAAMAAKVAA